MQFISLLIMSLSFCISVSAVAAAAEDSSNMSLSEHEASALSVSFNQAINQYNELQTAGEKYKALPYIARAFSLINEALLQDQNLPTENPKFLKVYENIAINYGTALISTRRLDEAHDHLSTLLNFQEDWHGGKSIDLVDTLMALGMSRIEYRGNRASNLYFDRAIELARQHEGDNSSLVGKLYLDISQASLLNASGDWRKASRKLKKAHELLLEEEGLNHRDTAISAYRIGELAVIRKKYKEAVDYLEQAVTVFDTNEPYNRATQRMHELLVKTYSNLGQSDAATKHCQMVGKIKEVNGDSEKSGLGYMPIHRAQPRYPRTAIERGQEGQVTIELTVTAEGNVSDIRVLANEGPKSLVKASIKAAEKFRYAARHENGAPVDTKGVQYRFSFNLAR